MFTLARGLLFSIFFAGICLCQQNSGPLSARELYYHEKPDNDKLPSPSQVRSALKPAATKTASKSNVPPETTPRANAGSFDNSGATISKASLTVPPVQNFGLRYNVLLVNTQSAKAEPADPDRAFQPKECLALEFESNRSGYLYVFEQASSGKWQPMFPTAELPDESNIVRSRKKIRIPANDCFEVSGDPGVDRVFVVLSRNLEDISDLSQSVKGDGDAVVPPAPRRERTPVVISDNRLGDEIAKMRAGLQGRELTLKKVSKPESSDEPANSVYIVNTSATSSDRVVAEIRINHR